jgi:hypothetical protein
MITSKLWHTVWHVTSEFELLVPFQEFWASSVVPGSRSEFIFM